jgi:hypothetical protein
MLLINKTNKNTRKLSPGKFIYIFSSNLHSEVKNDRAFSVKISCLAQSAGNCNTGSSETIRVASFNKKVFCFNQWLAGLIDGDGYFGVSRSNGTNAGHVSCEITVHSDEVQALYKIQKKCGGKVHQRVGVNAYRWRIHSVAGMRNLIERVNGHILLLKRYKQMERVCDILQITSKPAPSVSQNSSWLVGFFDAEGHIRINPLNKQVQLTIGQKDQKILEQIQKVWKGSIFFDKSWNGYVWVVSALAELSPFVNYLFDYKLQIPTKQARLHTFKRYLLYRSRATPSDLIQMAKIIENFKKKEKDRVH